MRDDTAVFARVDLELHPSSLASNSVGQLRLPAMRLAGSRKIHGRPCISCPRQFNASTSCNTRRDGSHPSLDLGANDGILRDRGREQSK
jgi:hypothetical protein